MNSLPTPPTRQQPSLVGILTAIAGFALFAFFVNRVGLEDVTAGIVRIGWGFLGILVLSGARFVLRGAAWLRCLPPRHGLGLQDIVTASLAGDALGNLTPLSIALGEPVKALYLKDQAPLSNTMPALAVETLFYTLSVVVVIAAGGATLFVLISPPAIEGLVTAVPIVTLAALVIGVHWLLWKRIPLASKVLRFVARLQIASTFVARIEQYALDIEQRVHRDYPKDWSRVTSVAALHLTFHALAIAEIFLVLWLISDQPPTVLDAFVLEAVNRFINVAFKFVPMRIGVDEAGTAFFSNLLAFGTAAGVTIAIARKARMLVWTGVGIAALIRRGLLLTPFK